MNEKTSRRQFFAYSAALTATVAACSREQASTTDGGTVADASPMIDLTAVAALSAMNSGEFSAEEYARALLENADEFRGKRVCLVVSGGNVDPTLYAELLATDPKLYG